VTVFSTRYLKTKKSQEHQIWHKGGIKYEDDAHSQISGKSLLIEAKFTKNA